MKKIAKDFGNKINEKLTAIMLSNKKLWNWCNVKDSKCKHNAMSRYERMSIYNAKRY